MQRIFRIGIVVVGMLGISMAGCGGGTGPETAPVSGTVTMDSQPLAGVVVGFYPQGDGNASMGTTDSSGQYYLRYNARNDGAHLGDHNVRIVTPTDDAGQPVGPPVPAKYNTDSTLTATVKDTNNKIDFDLQSK